MSKILTINPEEMDIAIHAIEAWLDGPGEHADLQEFAAAKSFVGKLRMILSEMDGPAKPTLTLIFGGKSPTI